MDFEREYPETEEGSDLLLLGGELLLLFLGERPFDTISWDIFEDLLK